MTPKSLARTLAASILLLCGAVAVAQDTPTLLVLRPIPKAQAKTQEIDLNTKPVLQSDLTGIKIGGKPATITSWTPLLNGPTILQLVVLLDSEQRIGINTQFDDIRNLFVSLPSNVEIAIGYMLQGNAKITQPFTTDRILAGNALRTPTKEDVLSPKNDIGDPYYCLQDLAAHWPDPGPKKVRAVLVFTDGAAHHRDLGITAVSEDLMRAGIAPFPVYYFDRSINDRPGQMPAGNCRPCLDQLVVNTNGQAFYYRNLLNTTEGISFAPLLYQFFSILHSEAVVTVTAKGSGIKPLDIKSTNPDLKVAGPDQVMIGNAMPRK